MAPDEFLRRMQYIEEKYEGPRNSDPEMAHSLADDLMCEVLSSIGYEKGVEIFQNMELWYS